MGDKMNTGDESLDLNNDEKPEKNLLKDDEEAENPGELTDEEEESVDYDSDDEV